MSEASATAQEIIDRWESGCSVEELKAMIESAFTEKDAEIASLTRHREMLLGDRAKADVALAEVRVKALKEVGAIVQEWERAYPESVFPPFTAGTPDLELSRDRIAAAMARHMTRELLKQINALAQMSGG